MTTYYKAVPVSEELPEKPGWYYVHEAISKSFVHKDRIYYDLQSGWHTVRRVTKWLKPCEGVMLTRETWDKVCDLAVKLNMKAPNEGGTMTLTGELVKLLLSINDNPASDDGENQNK